VSFRRTVPAATLVATALLSACGSSESTHAQPRPSDAFPVGSRASFVVNAHCGVEWAFIDGYSWHTRLRDDGNGNPPRGWPQQIDGVLTRPSKHRAIFVSEQISVKLIFRPAPNAQWSCL
jgi:hypothetical protein